MITNYFHDCRVDSLAVVCPICAAQCGQHCKEEDGVQLINHPHLYRIQVAAEEGSR